MSGILAKYGALSTLLLGAIIFFGVLYGLYWLISKRPKTFWTIFITAIFAGIFALASNKYILPKIAGIFKNDVSKEIIIYDTDPQNDEFIKGSLKRPKQKQLDRLLMKEKKACGLRFSNQLLQEYSKNDNEIISAYNRWRKCKEMRRSHHHVIYPDERDLYLN